VEAVTSTHPAARSLPRERALELDRADPLAAFHDRFAFPDPALVYLDGNSLGRLPLATVDRLREVVEREWGERLIRSWSEGWFDLPMRVGDLIGRAAV
jgi:kynureninase